MPRRLAAAVPFLVLAAPGGARALDRFEIQVYQADVEEPGEPGLEMHLNYTISGVRQPEYPGEIPPDHVGRLTLEPAVGVTDWLELGAYLQFMLAPGGDARYAGVKLRAKMVVPERLQERLGLPVFLGINLELSRVPAAVEQAAWANELRPIIGWKGRRWLLVANPVLGWALSGGDRFRLELEPCAKVAYDTQLGFAVGLEYYAGLGFIGEGFSPLHQQEHLLFGVVDLVERRSADAGRSAAGSSPWEVNLGFGGSLTDATGPHLIAKAIFGHSF